MTSESKTFSFLQLSNVNLDSPQLIGMRFPQAKMSERAHEVMESLRRCLQEGKQREVEAVLIVGSLFHNGTVSKKTISRLVDLFSELDDIPVFIAPGKFDAYAIDSPYNPQFLKALGLSCWSDNVRIFNQSDWTAMNHPFLPAVSVVGHSYSSEKKVSTKQWKSALQNCKGTKCKILLLTEPAEKMFAASEVSEDSHSSVLSDDELRNSGFDYIALGFGTCQGRLFDVKGRLIGAQSGSLVGQSFVETGARVALFGQILFSENSQLECTVETQEFDTRRIWNYVADMSGLLVEDAVVEIMQSLEGLGARSSEDIVHLTLEGRYQADEQPARIIEKIREGYFHVFVQDNTRPNYLSESFAQGSSESRFVKAMLVLKKEAEKRKVREITTSQGAKTLAGFHHLSGRVVEDALYYGLEAIRQKKVNLRNVD